MRKALGIMACLCAAMSVAVPVAAQQGGDVKAQIEKVNEAFVAAFGGGDAAAVAKMYSSDAQVFAPNSDVITGAEAIQKFWKGAMDMGVKSATLRTTEAQPHGATRAHEVGTYAMLGADGKELDRGKYIVIWKKEGNAWKIHRDIWNTSMPAAR
jgi:uncharacterized protein (TIGR02246 family)